MSMIVEGLTKRFGEILAVDDLNFKVKEGSIFGILGPNGAGKTTTIRMLACLISPTTGYANVCGYNIEEDSLKVREIVGVLTENPSLYERLTAYENMDFFAEAYGILNSEDRVERISQLLNFFNLWERREDKVATFSKGMKQKLAIARALVHNPPILLLDEPTSALDPESAKAIRDLIKALSEHEKHTILLCTHRLEDAEKLCNKVMIINRGHCTIIGTPRELQDRIAGETTIQISLSELNNKIIKKIKKSVLVKEVKIFQNEAKIIISIDELKTSVPEIVRRIVNAGGMILSVGYLRPSLEEAYLKLVKDDDNEIK
jgi:ABC-2 type transport system ATP-binding protein